MRVLSAISLLGLLALAGCGKFFPKTSGGGGGCTTNCAATDFLYVANQNTTTPSLAAFSIANSALTAVVTTPYKLSVLPTALVINPANTFLYVGSLTGNIYLYGINTDGSLTAENTGNPVASTLGVAAMKIDTTGAYLLVANAGASSISVFSINSTTGALTTVTGSPFTLTSAGTGSFANGVSHMIITPNNQFVYVSEGTSGVGILTFDVTTGKLTESGHLNSGNSTTDSDQGLASDPSSKFLFLTETGANALRVLTIGTNGALTELSTSPTATGRGPTAVIVDATGTYVYVTNRTDSTVSGFTLAASGTLTALSASPYTTGSNPVDLVEDNTKTYVAVANTGGSSDLEVFKISTTIPGQLVSFANATTGTDPTVPVVVAATH